jgi:hypothetical protein
MIGAQRRGSKWTRDEDQRLLKLLRAGKSWVFISAALKRPSSTARIRYKHLVRQALEADFGNKPVELEPNA